MQRSKQLLSLPCLIGHVARTLVAAALLACAFTPSLQAQEEGWTINLEGADLRTFLHQVSEITGETYVLDSNITNTVTVISTVPLDKAGIIKLLHNVLQVNGFGIARNGDVNVITLQQNIASSNAPATQSAEATDGIVTKVLTPRGSSAMDLQTALMGILSPLGSIQALPKNNALIITDYAANVRKVETLLGEIATRSAKNYDVIMLQNAWVGDILPILLNTFLGEDEANVTGLRISADEHNNAVVVHGNTEMRKEIVSFVKKMDNPSSQNRATNVVYLRHTSAQDTATLLTNFLHQTDANKEGLKPGLSIQAEPSLNALVLRADPATMKELMDVIEKLDIPQAQVHIEGAIVEITGNVLDELGIQYALGDAATSSFELAMASFTNVGPALAAVMNSATPNNPSLAAARSNGFSAGISNRNDFSVLLSALAASSNANLLSTPSITTLDNEEAKIVVGQNVPFRTGTFTNDNGDQNPFTTIERRDVGITLKVKPRIHEGNMVRLKVAQEVSSLVEDRTSDAADIITNTRSIDTTILASDGETIVLGGLIQDDANDSESKVPLLGDIPGLGFLFSSNRENKVKRNLLVFLRPTIVRDSGVLDSITQQKYQHIWRQKMQQENRDEAGRPAAYPPIGSLFDHTHSLSQIQRPANTAHQAEPAIPQPVAVVDELAPPVPPSQPTALPWLTQAAPAPLPTSLPAPAPVQLTPVAAPIPAQTLQAPRTQSISRREFVVPQRYVPPARGNSNTVR